MMNFVGRATCRVRKAVAKERQTATIHTCSGRTPALLILMVASFGLAMLVGCASRVGDPLSSAISIIDASAGQIDRECDKCTFPRDGLKIGLLADSHFQTLKSLDFVPGLKGRTETTFSTVLRASGRNYISPLVLSYFIDRLKKENVDVILYLGDGASNGCSDEINSVLKILDETREEKQVPIYYLIGNHDYLGAGNTDKWDERVRLCDDRPLALLRFKIEKLGEFGKPPLKKDDQFTQLLEESAYNLPLTKFQVIRKIANFNQGNAKKYGEHAYRDSYTDDDRVTLRKECVQQSPATEQHRKDRCFFAGWANLKGTPLLLMDTSNYTSDPMPLGLLTRLQNLGSKVGETEYYGDLGYITDEQIKWLKEKFADESKQGSLIVASHYPLARFNVAREEEEKIFDQVCSLISSSAEGRGATSHTVWVSAHTHEPPTYASRKCKDSGMTLHMLNIGSTVDWAKPFGPHAAVLSLADSKKIAVKFVTLPYDQAKNYAIDPETSSETSCKKIIAKMCKGEFLSSDVDYLRTTDQEEACSSLGLGANYIKKVFEEGIQFLGLGFRNYQRNEDVFPPLNLIRFAQAVENDNELFENIPEKERHQVLGACLAGFSARLTGPDSVSCGTLCERSLGKDSR
jgi:3',5'-cyclic AMP phosphodiesterase CpdA